MIEFMRIEGSKVNSEKFKNKVSGSTLSSIDRDSHIEVIQRG